jgi:hypothetical protein
MSGYTKGAALVVQALQKVEDDRETIWSDVALLTIADFSPVDSLLARVLRSDSVWDRTMREQLRAGHSGKPGTEHLRPRSKSGFNLQLLIERAEQYKEEAGDTLVAERHLARALVEMLREDLRAQGINGQRLVEEVATLELSPERKKIEEALDLERLRFAKAREEIEREARGRSSAVQVDMARRGLTGSGLHLGSVIEGHVEMLRATARRRVELRKEMLAAVPELGSTDHLDRLKQKIEEMVDAQWANLHIGIARSVGGVSAEGDVRRILGSGGFADAPLKIKSEVARELEMLKREVRLGMREPTGRPGIIVNIQGSTVAALNLGNVMGNIQSVVMSLQERGNAELAQGLKELIEKVASAEELGNQRRDVIESLTTVGEQAALPEDQRRPGMVKTLLASVGAALGHVANLAQIWQTLAPMVARHFGLPWP